MQWQQDYPLTMTWFNRPVVVLFDVYPEKTQPAGWCRFVAPSGLRAMNVVARGPVRVWANGKLVNIAVEKVRLDRSREPRAVVDQRARKTMRVAIRVQQEHSSCAGAALPEPGSLECGMGIVELGDWSRIDAPPPA